MSKTRMKVSIIVPAFNEAKMLPRSIPAILEAASAFNLPGWEFEIVVCDNNSTDGTGELARELGAKVVFEPINQIARSRNSGAAAATGDWFVFVDADSFPSRELFARVAEIIKQGKSIGGGCLLKLDENRLHTSVLLEMWNTASRLFRWAAGSFIFCEASAFHAVGGFSTNLYAGEEIEFSKQLKKHARARRKRMRIISDERLLTSARKMHLYTGREHFRFLLRALFFPKQVLGNPAECHTWYDGRR